VGPAQILNAFGHWLIPRMAQLSLEVVVLAAVVVAVVCGLRVASARLRQAFWATVLAKPLVSLLIASPVSLYWFLHPPSLELPAAITAPPALEAPRVPRAAPVFAPSELPAERSAPRPAPGWWQRLDAYGVAASVWTLCAGALALRLFLGLAFVSFLRRTASPQRDGPLVEAARAAAEALGMRRPVRVALSTVAHGPVLAGVVRPQVLLPTRMVQLLRDDQLRLVIAHESAHARHRDNLFLLMRRLTEVLLFFHPVVWLCGWVVGRDVESACDDAVVSAFDGARTAYAGSLVEVAAISRQGHMAPVFHLFASTFAASETGFTQRVRRVLDGRGRRMPVGLAVASVLALLAIGAIGLPRASERSDREVPSPQTADTQGEAPMSRDGGEATQSTERRIRREDGKVWIEGMEEVNWGGSFFTREDSQVRCLVEALQCAGRSVTYAQAMGLSGAAFKITMAPDLFVAEMHSEMGMDWTEILSRVWGVEYSWNAISCNDEKNPTWPQQLRDAAVESIDRGMPLFYMNGEWNLLVGYLEDGSGYLCMPYAGSEDGYKEMVKPSGFVGEIWFASVLREAGEPADRRATVLRSLGDAVELAVRPAEKNGERLFGTAAYETWIAALEENREGASLHGNAFSYSQLLTSRQAASEYLRGIAAELGDDAAPHLGAAAERYDRIGQRLWDGRDCVKHPWDENWTPENRARQAQILRECQADEQQAVAAMETALGSLGEPPAGGGVATPMHSGAAPAPARVLLEDLRRHDIPMNQLGNLLACAHHLGYAGTDAWLAGATGFAFALNVGPGLCPSGPSAWADHKLLPLAANVGLPVRTYYGAESQPDFEARRREAFDEVRAAIDSGQPIIGTGMRTPEVYLIQGYDGEGNYLYLDHQDGGLHQRHHEDLDFLWFQFPDLGEPTDDRTAVREGLAAALRLAAGTDFDSAQCGLRGYDNWMAGLAQGSVADALGAAYNAGCWHSCRQLAVPFLRQARERLGDAALNVHFDVAIERYGQVADRLQHVAELFPLSFGDAAMEERLAEAARREQARRALAEARDAEVEGLRSLAALCAALGGPRVDVAALGVAVADAGSSHRAPAGAVLLEEAVADFEHIASEVAGHRMVACVRGATEAVYPQPYCYLTTMLVQMHAAGWPEMDLEALAAVSGASAFFGYDADSFMPKYAFHRRDPHALVARATGFRAEWLRVGDVQEAWEVVREAVDAGCPVAGWHGEMFLLAGYLDAADPANRQVFAMKDGNGYFTEWWTWQELTEWVGEGQHVSRFAGRRDPSPPRDVALRVIEDLVALSAGVPPDIQEAFPQSTFGLAGIRAYADDHDADGSRDEVTMCHPVNPQWTVRAGTARYLQAIADQQVLGSDASTHVTRAAQEYRAAYAAWQEAYGLVAYFAEVGRPFRGKLAA